MARCDSYIGGECTWGACQLAGWVREWWGNAADWPNSAERDGFFVGGTPRAGAIVAWRDAGVYSGFGHVAYVLRVDGSGWFYVQEMNFVAAWRYDYRETTAYGLVGFIYPPDWAPPPPGGGAGGAVSNDPHVAWSGVQQWWNRGIEDDTNRLTGHASYMGFYGRV